MFSDVIDKHVPLKQHRVKKIKQPECLTSEIIDSIKTRDHYKAIGDTDQYKKWRNNVVNLIRKAKKKNYEKLIEEGANQPTTIWKIFSELGAGRQKSDSSSCTNAIKIGEHEIFKPEDMANTFNDFFVNVAETRTVRGSDYSPAIELSEQKEQLVTATGDIEKYSEKQANKVWLNSVDWFSRY